MRFIRAPTVMLAARQAVLLTPSKSLGPTQLLSCKQNAAVSPLLAALTSSSDPSHSIAFSRPLFSYSYELFCASEITTLLFSCKSKLLCKNTGGGVRSLHSGTTHYQQLITHFPSFFASKTQSPPPYFQQLAHNSAFTGEGEGTPRCHLDRREGSALFLIVPHSLCERPHTHNSDEQGFKC